jgi:hypothetical protein
MAEHRSEIDEFGNNDDFWIFGYGYVDAVSFSACPNLTRYRSLIWKPPPHYGKIRNASYLSWCLMLRFL